MNEDGALRERATDDGATIVLHVGVKRPVKVRAVDGAGRPMPMPAGTLSYGTSDPAVFTVGPPLAAKRGAVLEGIKAGTATLRAVLTKPDGATLAGAVPVQVIAGDAVALEIS